MLNSDYPLPTFRGLLLSWEGKEESTFRSESFPFATIVFVIGQFPFVYFHLSYSMENEK